MSTATSSRPQTLPVARENRETIVFEAVDFYLAAHDKWVNSPDTIITEEYEDAIGEMFDVLRIGDVPARCRPLLESAERLATQWRRFEEEATAKHPHPPADFWSAVENLRQKRKGAIPKPPPKLESVKSLVKQGVSSHQIAHRIYGHHGEGPFLVNGVVQEDLIEQEAENPGSVIGKDWVHPQYTQQQRMEEELTSRRRERLSERLRPKNDCPESIEELLQQRVPVKQILMMKDCQEDEVLAVAKRLGIKVQMKASLDGERVDPDEAEPLGNGDNFGSNDQEPIAGDLSSLVATEDPENLEFSDDNGDEGEGDDDIGANNDSAIATEDDELMLTIYALADQGLPAKEIAGRIGMDGRRVAGILRRRPEGV